MTNSYQIGQRVKITATFVDDSSPPVATDPTTVVARVKGPDGVETSYTYPDTVVKESTGVYSLEVDIEDAGLLWYRFEGTGTIQTANESAMIGDRSQFNV